MKAKVKQIVGKLRKPLKSTRRKVTLTKKVQTFAAHREENQAFW